MPETFTWYFLGEIRDVRWDCDPVGCNKNKVAQAGGFHIHADMKHVGHCHKTTMHL